MDDVMQALLSDEVAIVATDTVYGLIARPGSEGERRIFDVKQRPADQPLPWLVSGRERIDSYGADAPAYARRLADMFWPGALTLVIRASDEARAIGPVGDDGTVALRCPDDADLLALLDALDGPLACTSANLHGDAPAHVRDAVPASMRALVGYETLEDRDDAPSASTIVDCTGAYPIILREGPIPAQVVLDVAVFGATLTDSPRD